MVRFSRGAAAVAVLMSSATLVAQVAAPGAPAPTPTPAKGRYAAAAATKDSGIPPVSPVITASPATPIAPYAVDPAHPDRPLPRLDPLYPYPTNPASDAVSGVRRVTTLNDALALAYQSNPLLASQRATLRSADFGYPAARAAYGPTLNATGSYTYTRNRFELIPGLFAGDQGFASTASAILSIPLFTGGRNRAAESSALATIAYERERLRSIEQQTLLAVITAYVGVLRDATAVRIADQNNALLERQLGDSQERFRVREITSSDLLQVQTRVEFARAQLLSARGQLAVTQSEFLRDVGALPGELQPLPELALPTGDLSNAYALADVGSPIINAAQAREKVSRAAVAAARAEYMPRVDLTGGATYGSVSPYNDKLRNTTLQGGVTVTAPIIDTGLRNARRGQAVEANSADLLLIDSAMRDVRAEVGSSWNLLATTRATLEYYRRSVDAAFGAYEGARLQERAGDRTTLDVLDLARDLLTVQTNFNTALANEYLARARLLVAIGQLEAPRLLPGLNAYDPEAHFRKVGNDSDIPLLTPVLSAFDGVLGGTVKGDRVIRDPASATPAVGEVVPLPPESAIPAVSDPTQDEDRSR